jgi:exopolyphosphatase/guanosine-5'-triphosphate,3'-diphosphate pyrophosphatase
MIWSRRAVIDVGTNSVKLLVAEVSGAVVRPLVERSEQTRLGSGFYETHCLQPEAIEKTAQAVARFAAEAKPWTPAVLRVVATSAARDAINQAELLESIRRASGLEVEIISGEREADWVFAGVTSDPRFAARNLLILDVGGGSTEFILGRDSQPSFRSSFPLGTVRLLEQLRPGDPPSEADRGKCREWLRRFLDEEIAPALQPVLTGKSGSTQLVGTGGTTTILARIQLGAAAFDRSQIESVNLTREQVAEWSHRLWSMPLNERRQVAGLPPNRADVILPGAAIFEAVMERFEFNDLCVSTRGLRFAAVMGLDQRGSGGNLSSINENEP